MRGAGLEPALPEEHRLKRCVLDHSTIRAKSHFCGETLYLTPFHIPKHRFKLYFRDSRPRRPRHPPRPAHTTLLDKADTLTMYPTISINNARNTNVRRL